MATFVVFFSSSSIFFLFIFHTAAGVEHCSQSSCQPFGPPVRFPFRLQDRQPYLCGYLGFDLSCNNQSQTILNLQDSGDFTVQRIDYEAQTIWLNDPDNCLPKRFLNLTFPFPNFRFSVVFRRYFTFYNCSTDTAVVYPLRPIPCLSGDNYTVMAAPTGSFYAESTTLTCMVIATVLVPVPGRRWMELTDDFLLVWGEPDCSYCELRRGTCGYKKNTADLEVGCFNLPNGLSKGAKFGITLGIGIPALLCMIGVSSYACRRIRSRDDWPNLNISASTGTETAVPSIGLDGPTIESYPKTLLGESRRLPNPSDNICPICLSEYQPKETLRTIPECNHYFHADCIDEWLRKKTTCPLCRNSPDGSSTFTTSSSSSSFLTRS